MPREHTPEPWEWESCTEDSSEKWSLRAGNRDVLQANRDGAIEIENEADARLIAAAPDLLDACRRIDQAEGLASDKHDYMALYQNALDHVRAAIAKAEGEPDAS